MKKALTAGLVLAGIIALSGTSFAEVKASNTIRKRSTTMYDTQRPPEPPRKPERTPHTSGEEYGERGRHEFPDRRHPGGRPPISPDRRHYEPENDRRRPLEPHEPPYNGHHRFDPDRRLPENRRPPLQQGVAPR